MTLIPKFSASWGKGSKKSAETVAGQNQTDETALNVSAEGAQAPETSTENQSRNEETRADASLKREPESKSETPSDKAKEAPPPATISQEDQNKIAKLRQISQMWQFRPIPPGPEASQERRADAVRYGNAHVIGASVRGKKHIHGGSDCDDWFEIRAEQETGAIFIAVSDGAGSKKFSRIGARVSCQAAVESLQESFCYLSEECPERLRQFRLPEEKNVDSDAQSLLREIVSTAMRKAQDSLYCAFEKRIGNPAYEDLQAYRDLSATLLLAVIIPSQSGEHAVAVCQVGDGAIALFDSNASYERAMSILGTPDSGDYAGETEFMTSPSLNRQEFERRVITRRLRFDSLLVMTDGVADDYFPANPELFRLYCDLAANGVLPPKRAESPGEPIPIPEPIAFPNADAEKETVSLNYVWLIQSAANLSLKDLWDDPSTLERAFRLLPPRESAEESEKRLAYWLEHYVEAASFDDRTLVVARITEEGGEGNGAKKGQTDENAGKAVRGDSDSKSLIL